MTTIERAQQVITNLQQEVAQLRSENSHLRRKTGGAHAYHYNTSGRILRRALDDARALLVLGFNEFPLSRRFCNELGFSTRRYYWAIGLLRSARLMDVRGRQIVADDFALAERKLQGRYDSLKTTVDALELLRVYMPKFMGNVYHGHRKQ
ncbi:MAG: hypothetical protein R2867_42185 [Caldilineaceae bacterium]